MAPDYVVGFCFFGTPTDPSVVLIRKKRPAWQEGKLNGIGGHIEPNENPYQAMNREWSEETMGMPVEWSDYARWNSDAGGFVHAFVAYEPNLDAAKLVNKDEDLALVSVKDVSLNSLHWEPIARLRVDNFIYNIPWLVHMAWSSHVTKSYYDLVERMPAGFFRR